MQVAGKNTSFSLNIKGELLSLETPRIMGILNVTPDSFYTGSRCGARETVLRRATEILEEGGAFIDVGAYSSRPSAAPVSGEEEMRRLFPALETILKSYPDARISVDTFRASVARRCVEEYGVSMINDISGGGLDKEMYATVADLQVPYILMHMRGTPQTMMEYTGYDHLIGDMMYYFSERVEKLTLLGAKDIILDPGFGFSKTLDDNYLLMDKLSVFTEFGLPLLVGISRKSMIYKLLDTGPENALNGTSVLNTLALLGGADILRVHDVKAAVETVEIVVKTLRSK